MGIVLIFLLVVQLALGWFIHHQFNPDRLKRPITNWIHMAFGISITVLSFATLYKGIRLYQGGKWTTVLYWVWMGVS
jgi:drug/metabolite transporter (DMT)-like permease